MEYKASFPLSPMEIQFNNNTWIDSFYEKSTSTGETQYSCTPGECETRCIETGRKIHAPSQHSLSSWHTTHFGENTELLASAWVGKEKTGPYTKHYDFWGTDQRIGFCLTCLIECVRNGIIQMPRGLLRTKRSWAGCAAAFLYNRHQGAEESMSSRKEISKSF